MLSNIICKSCGDDVDEKSLRVRDCVKCKHKTVFSQRVSYTCKCGYDQWWIRSMVDVR